MPSTPPYASLQPTDARRDLVVGRGHKAVRQIRCTSETCRYLLLLMFTRSIGVSERILVRAPAPVKSAGGTVGYSPKLAG
jgi:hypothetical protein